jgi:hypothetical protein
MDQKTIVIDRDMKEMFLDAIHDDLVGTLKKEGVTYCMATQHG